MRLYFLVYIIFASQCRYLASGETSTAVQTMSYPIYLDKNHDKVDVDGETYFKRYFYFYSKDNEERK